MSQRTTHSSHAFNVFHQTTTLSVRYADSYRAMLREGSGDIDLDFCVPSTTLVAYMMKHLLVFEPRDENSLWILKGAPRRFYAPNSPAVTVTGAVTRYCQPPIIPSLSSFFFHNGAKNIDLRCVLQPAPSGAGCKTRRESRIKKLNPISFVIDFSGQFTYEKWHATDWLPTLVSMAAGSSWSNFVSKSCTLD